MTSRGTRRAASLLSCAVLGLALLALSAGTGACELDVPATVPSFSCVPGPDSCPTDQVCSPATMQCVLRSQACTVVGCPPGISCNKETLACSSGSAAVDGSVGVDGQVVRDGSPDSDASSFPTCSTLACPCSGAADCQSGICADELTVTSDVYDAAKQESFCTKPCCTSADCDESTVCFATAARGNYCVRPEWLGRTTTVGAGLGGGACSVDADCRSGLCAAMSCADTCCSTAHSATECSPGTTCDFGIFPGNAFDVHYTAYCTATSGTGANGSTCASSEQCMGGLCAQDNRCHDACRNSQDCGSSSQECGYAISPVMTSAFIAACSSSPGTGEEGASCQGDGDCLSGFCDSASMQCTDVCFADSDCTANGWRCRPEVVVLGQVSFSYLACGS